MKIAILSDIHSNLEALECCLAHARNQGAERYACLGDIVGYGADPGPVVERLMALPGLIAVRGNHDEALFVHEASPFAPPGMHAAIRWTRTALDETQRRFLAGLPYLREEGGVTYVHASCHNPQEWEYVYGGLQAAECLAAARTPLVFLGHTHLPCIFYETPGGTVRELEPHAGEAIPLSPRARYVVSAGSVGQPRDGNPAACYVLHDSGRREIAFHRLSYACDRTAQKIAAAGLEPFFAARLALGR
jgi:diadenosine tetraphosphatase ApaH/serine/threonine PP2A family protein phosphatase